jgi:hypothetical protein
MSSRLTSRTGRLLRLAAGAAAVFFVLVVAVSEVWKQRALTHRDEWHAPPANEEEWLQQAALLDPADVLQVQSAKLPEAVSLLQREAAVEIDLQQAEQLSGEHPFVNPEKRLFLLRSVRHNRVSRSRVYRMATAVWVHNISMASRMTTMEKHSVVVQLPEKPMVVYNSSERVE